MKVIAINGSPRKSWNTAALLRKALEGAESAGAETELVHLYDLNYQGCTSCFACKRKNSPFIGHCAIKDNLTDVLERILDCDALLLGSPIYFGNLTGEMLSFLERFLFSNIAYEKDHRTVFQGKLTSGFIYTMNVPEDLMQQYNYEFVFEHYREILQRFGGTSEIVISNDTYQFDDYSKYDASMFDEAHKAQVKAEQFPVDLKNAFDMGVRLAAKQG